MCMPFFYGRKCLCVTERNIQQAADVERCQKELKVNDKERCQLKQQLDYMKVSV